MKSFPLRSLLAGVALTAALTVPASAPRAADDPNEVVGRAGSVEIKLGQVRAFVNRLDPAARQQAQKDPQVVARLVRNELGRLSLLNELTAKKWDQRPEVQAQIENARQQMLVSSYLQSVVQLPPGFPSDAEVQAAYDSNKGNLMKPGEYHLAQIFLMVSASADKGVIDALQRRAEDLARKAHAKGADFATLARESSDDKDSAAKGGDLGWINGQMLLPEIRNIVASMGKGEISQAVHTPAGFHVVKLIDVKPSTVAPLAEVRDGLIGTLRQRKLEELQAAYVNAMLDHAGLAINEVALRKAVGPTP